MRRLPLQDGSLFEWVDRAVLEKSPCLLIPCLLTRTPVVTCSQGYSPRSVTCTSSGGRILATIQVPKANPLWDRGITGQGQVVGVGDTGADYSNCLLSESPKADPPFSQVDLARRKLVGYYYSSTDCALCDGCPKKIPWDAHRVPLGVQGQVSDGRIYTVAWPNSCIDPALSKPVGCANFSRDALLEPRRYDRLGATLDLDVMATSPGGQEFGTKVKVFVLDRDAYDAFLDEGNMVQDPPSSKCLNSVIAPSAKHKPYANIATIQRQSFPKTPTRTPLPQPTVSLRDDDDSFIVK